MSNRAEDLVIKHLEIFGTQTNTQYFTIKVTDLKKRYQLHTVILIRQ